MRGLPDLVALKLAYEVPNDIVRKPISLLNEFLDAAFAKMPMSEVIQSLDFLNRLKLANGNQRDAVRPSARQRTCICDPLVDLVVGFSHD